MQSRASPIFSRSPTLHAQVQGKVPAITHVDGSARLQTVAASDVPLYHALILAFLALSGGTKLSARASNPMGNICLDPCICAQFRAPVPHPCYPCCPSLGYPCSLSQSQWS